MYPITHAPSFPLSNWPSCLKALTCLHLLGGCCVVSYEYVLKSVYCQVLVPASKQSLSEPAFSCSCCLSHGLPSSQSPLQIYFVWAQVTVFFQFPFVGCLSIPLHGVRALPCPCTFLRSPFWSPELKTVWPLGPCATSHASYGTVTLVHTRDCNFLFMVMLHW